MYTYIYRETNNEISLNNMMKMISIPNHDNCNYSNTKKHCQKPKPWSVETALPLRFEAFRYQMIDSNIDKNTTSNAH